VESSLTSNKQKERKLVYKDNGVLSYFRCLPICALLVDVVEAPGKKKKTTTTCYQTFKKCGICINRHSSRVQDHSQEKPVRPTATHVTKKRGQEEGPQEYITTLTKEEVEGDRDRNYGLPRLLPYGLLLLCLSCHYKRKLNHKDHCKHQRKHH